MMFVAIITFTCCGMVVVERRESQWYNKPKKIDRYVELRNLYPTTSEKKTGRYTFNSKMKRGIFGT
jgi:hypothetical protein